MAKWRRDGEGVRMSPLSESQGERELPTAASLSTCHDFKMSVSCVS